MDLALRVAPSELKGRGRAWSSRLLQRMSAGLGHSLTNTVFLPSPLVIRENSLERWSAKSGLRSFPQQGRRAHRSLICLGASAGPSSGASVHTAPSHPRLQLLSIRSRAAHWLGSDSLQSPTSRRLPGRAMSCSAPAPARILWCLYQFIWSLVESLLHDGNLTYMCSLSPMGTPTHSSLPAQPKPLREQPPAGGGWRGLRCDHNHGCGRWQSVL